MPSGPPSGPNPAQRTPPPAPAPADRQKLIEAYQDLVRSEREKKAHPPIEEPPPARHRFTLTMLALAATLGVVLYLQPPWLFTPPPPPESPQVQDASLRVVMFRAIELLNQYRQVHGRLPSSLPDAGVDTTGLSYAPSVESFTLTGRNGPVSLTYSSSTDPAQFLGTSYAIIRGRFRR